MILLDLRLLPVLVELMEDSLGGGASLASAWNEIVLCIVVREDIGSAEKGKEMSAALQTPSMAAGVTMCVKDADAEVKRTGVPNGGVMQPGLSSVLLKQRQTVDD